MFKIENDANEIMKGLWLGNSNSAYDLTFLRNNNIKNIISVIPDFNYQYRIHDINYMIIPISDKFLENINTNNIFNVATEFIRYCLTNNQNILVHCKRGHHRSATIILAYFIKYLKYNYKQSVDYITKYRPLALRRDTNILRSLFIWLN